MKGFYKIIIIYILIIVFAGNTKGDHLIKRVSVSERIETAEFVYPQMTDTSLVWMNDKNFYLKDLHGVISIHLDKNFLYWIDHSTKTYYEVSLNSTSDFILLQRNVIFNDENMLKVLKYVHSHGFSESMRQKFENSADGQEAMESIRNAADFLYGLVDSTKQPIEISISAADETKKIRQWNCRKYIYTVRMPLIGESYNESWVTEDLDVDITNFVQAYLLLPKDWPGYDKYIKECKKFKGFDVYSISNMTIMGRKVKITSELLEYLETDPPEGIYDIPEGYTKLELRE